MLASFIGEGDLSGSLLLILRNQRDIAAHCNGSANSNNSLSALYLPAGKVKAGLGGLLIRHSDSLACTHGLRIEATLATIEVIGQSAGGQFNTCIGDSLSLALTLGIRITQSSPGIGLYTITADTILGRNSERDRFRLLRDCTHIPSYLIAIEGEALYRLFVHGEVARDFIDKTGASASGLSHRGNLSSNFLNQRREFLVDLLLTVQVIGIALTLGSQAIQILSLISQAQANGINLYAILFQISGLHSTVPIILIGIVYQTQLIQPGCAIGDKDDIFFALIIFRVQIALRLSQAGSVVGAAASIHIRNGLHKSLDTFTFRDQRVQAIA